MRTRRRGMARSPKTARRACRRNLRPAKRGCRPTRVGRRTRQSPQMLQYRPTLQRRAAAHRAALRLAVQWPRGPSQAARPRPRAPPARPRRRRSRRFCRTPLRHWPRQRRRRSSSRRRAPRRRAPRPRGRAPRWRRRRRTRLPRGPPAPRPPPTPPTPYIPPHPPPWCRAPGPATRRRVAATWLRAAVTLSRPWIAHTAARAARGR
mmetsp:Transcript_17676/g.61103  ORF Transcript_17676/g.61103 Transcript_17676/m.61103 type:complete len:206 (+) Transcript_17676:51-668(+)